MTNKITDNIGAGKPGPGRPRGSPNKVTAAVKDMVVQALNDAGGIDYLVAQSRDNPTAFLALVGKIIPLQGEMSHAVSLIGAGPMLLECKRES